MKGLSRIFRILGHLDDTPEPGSTAAGSPPPLYRPTCPPTTSLSDRNFWNHTFSPKAEIFHRIDMKMALQCVIFFQSQWDFW